MIKLLNIYSNMNSIFVFIFFCGAQSVCIYLMIEDIIRDSREKTHPPIDSDEEKLIKDFVESKYPNWTISTERDYLENLFVGRFNYFLVVFSIIVTAGFTTPMDDKYWVFFSGGLLLLACVVPLYRAYRKHDIVMKIIFRIPDHPTFLLDKVMKKSGFSGTFVVSKWQGKYIPFLCISFLFFMGFLTMLRCIN